MSEALLSQSLICSACNGSGLVNGRRCPTCVGLGSGVFLDGRLVYADANLSTPLIVLRQLKKTVYAVLDFLLIAGGIIGVAALVWWYAQVPAQITKLNELLFWRNKSPLVLIFWLSLVVDMMLVYRSRRRVYETEKIKKFKPSAEPRDWAEIAKRPKLNAAIGLDEALTVVLEKTYLLANQLKHRQITPLHLTYNLLTASGEVAGLFVRMNVNNDKLKEKLTNQLNKIEPGSGAPVLSLEVKQILAAAYAESYRLGQKAVGPADVLLPLWRADKLLEEIFYDLGIDEVKLVNTVAWARINDKLIYNYRLYKKMARFKPGSNMNRAYTAVATPFLDQLSFDLTAAAKYGRLDICVGRDQEIKQVFAHLASGQRGIVLVGEAGVGKNEIAEGVAQLMVTEEVPKMLKDKRLLELDVARLLGGATAAEAEERMLEVINETARAGNVVLYLQNIENITGLSVGSSDSLDLAEILTSAIARQGLYVLATCTNEHYRRNLANGPLAQSLAKVEVSEPEDNEAIQMIESKIAYFENKFKVYYTYDALAEAVKLSRRYEHEEYLPEKAITILDQAGVAAAAKGEWALVTTDDVAGVVSVATHVPVARVSEAESQLLLNLESEIHKRLVDQEEAVKVVAASLRRARAELREGKRPIANFLFLGPTGVGKTELAKTIAQVYFGDANYMIRLDMSEYQLAESVDKMIGASDGTLGYLTEKVRQAPFSLILLDEVEKAHPDILNLFLQVMDDGRLTDGQGRTVDFTNSIIIATSNIGAVYIEEQLKAGAALTTIQQTLIDKYLVEKMKPELINRFDGIIVFKPLAMDEVAAITRLMLNQTAELLKDKGMGLEASEAGVKVLAQAGFQPEFGARPLRRLLQDRIDNPIANKVLAGELKRRDTVIIDERGEVQVRPAAAL
jgi:ATP-dependent Clp protease ATP-binding subunit ClpC